VQEQFAYAQFASREEKEAAYKAVSEYFPPVGPGNQPNPENQRHAWLAMKGLALFYLNRDRLNEALPLYETLSYLDAEEERALHLTGLAGCAVIYDRQSEPGDGQVSTRFAICLAKLEAVSDEELQEIGNSLYVAVQEVLNKRRSGE
jgi:hypothetical protein